jgi:hypothetical protein
MGFIVANINEKLACSGDARRAALDNDQLFRLSFTSGNWQLKSYKSYKGSSMRNVYTVADGEVLCVATPTQPQAVLQVTQQCDWPNQIVVVAETEEQALELAKTFERGEIEPAEVKWQGKFLKALSQIRIS